MTEDVRRFLCVGAAHWDVIARADEPASPGDDVPGRIVRRPGGVALNVASGLARLGCDVSLIGAVGDDDEGLTLMQEIQCMGVGVEQVIRVDGATDRYVAIEDKDGGLIAAIADARLIGDSATEIADRTLSRLGDVDTLFIDANLPAAEIVRIARRAADHDVEVIVNPVSPAKAHRLTDVFDGSISFVIACNLAEANVLTGCRHESAIDAATALVRCGSGSALVTTGDGPAALATANGVVSQPPIAVPKGSSVTGAGDALLAAFLAFSDRLRDPEGALNAALQAAANKMRESN